MSVTRRSDCPINLTAELLGDRWSLVILRDIMFGDRRRYRVLLQQSEEGIASNILSARLKSLVEAGLLGAAEDPTHKQKIIYSLTEPSIELLPILIHMGAWGNENLDASPVIGPWFAYLLDQGPEVWRQLGDDLRHRHLGAPAPTSGATMATLTDDYLRTKRRPSKSRTRH